METITPTTAPPSVWPSSRYPDVGAAIDFLVGAFGFQPSALIPGATDGHYAHVELRWPEGSGGLMLGSLDQAEGYRSHIGGGTEWHYVVTTDPDALLARATAGGAVVVEDIHDEDYGNRTFCVTDPWGHFWTFGTYSGV
jgi:uncharacterized glyoxalase superfamily protein PhnB